MYDDTIPHSDNAIDPGVSKVHGSFPVNPFLSQPQHPVSKCFYVYIYGCDCCFQGSDVDRSWKAAQLPDEMGTVGLHSGQGSRGYPYRGSGKGGRNKKPRTLGEKKGLGGHRA